MKKLLATTAIALAMTGAASAQSVLERVLGQIDNATNLASVNGTFANIAENIGGSQTVYNNSTTGETLTPEEYQALFDSAVATDYTVIAANAYYVNPIDGTFITEGQYLALSTADQAAYTSANGYATDGAGNFITAAELAALPADAAALQTQIDGFNAVTVAGLSGIDGSISNVIDGITDATQTATAGVVDAVEYNMPTLNFGNMATTALGAVNTGDITLGVNSSVDDAKTTSTQAVSTVMEQIGGSADTGAIVLNVASNMTGVAGNITNTMTEVNGTIGNLSTTALGAVNTGTIVSGVNAAVNGITGKSGQTNGFPTP